MEKTVLLLWIGCLPGLLSATCSSNHSPDGTSSFQSRTSDSNCLNGWWCSEDRSCNCNPCWSGSTCQEYVDRFAPRFLAEEPFFMVTMGSERVGEWEVPLFRLESADDDLGLTCQLGQVGPAATCPCATPRYKVVGPSQAVFRADHETGDVFIKSGFSLLSGKHYLITLQVSGMEVNASGYQPWKEEVRATVYVKESESELSRGEFSHYRSDATRRESNLELTTNFPPKSPIAASPSPSTQLSYISIPQSLGRQAEFSERYPAQYPHQHQHQHQYQHQYQYQPSAYLSRSKRHARYSRSLKKEQQSEKTRNVVDASRGSRKTIFVPTQQSFRSRHIH